MKIKSIRQMVRIGTVFGGDTHSYEVVKINYDEKEMWLNWKISGTMEKVFRHKWLEDSEFRQYTLIRQSEPIELKDLI